MVVIYLESKLTSLELIDTVLDLGNNNTLSIQPADGFTVDIKKKDDILSVECTNHYLYERGLKVTIPISKIHTDLIPAIEGEYAN